MELNTNKAEPNKGIWGNGFHLSTVGESGVNCPICNCYNPPEYLEYKMSKKKNCYGNIKCIGCHRKIFCTMDFTGRWILSEL